MRAATANTTRLREDLIHPDPLLDCLLEVCRAHGVAASRASLSAGLPLADGRLSLFEAERAAARAGMATRLQRLRLADIDRASLPAIALTVDDSACVLLARHDDGTWDVLLQQTGAGAVRLGSDEMARRYAGITLFVRPQFHFDERAPEPRTTRSGHWFWGPLFAQRALYRDVLWAALLINVFAIAFPFFSMNVYDRVVPNQAIETLWALAAGIVLAVTAELVMRTLRSRFVDEASARIDVDISAALMQRVLGMQMANRPAAVGAFAANMRGFEQVRDFIASGTVTALIDLPFAVIFVLVLAWLSPWLALPVIVGFAVMLVVGWVLQRRLHELSQATQQAGALRNATLIETLAGIETVKTLSAEGVIQSRWERANAYLAEMTVRMRRLSSGALSTTTWLMQLVSVSLIVIGVHLIGQRELTMGALIAASMVAARALAPAGQIIGLLMQYQGARTALQSLDTIMAQPLERADGPALVHRRELRGEIEFRDVRFAYPGRQDSALEGVSFTIAAGERVALIGKVGSGKSTIQKLILGLYAPSDGQVLIDGIDQRQLDLADLRRNIGYVSQDVTLFYGSLRDNIAFGMPYADDAAIVEASRIAGLDEFVDRHPRGFEMPVGERGELLSGGQRQGVGLARALLHNAPLLLLDEPTSAMDHSTESEVTQRLAEFASDRTVVLVTHRTSLLALATRIIVIDQGKVMADGPREQILQALAHGRIRKAA